MVVANKSDLSVDPGLPHDSLEATALFDWENGYVECSAKRNLNVRKIFKELLNQAKPRYGVSLPASNNCSAACNRFANPPNSFALSKHLPLAGLLALKQQASKDQMNAGNLVRRRQSLPIVPTGFNCGVQGVGIPDAIEEENGDLVVESSQAKTKKRRSSLAAIRRDSCKIS